MIIPNLKERLSTRFKVDIPKPTFIICRCVRSQVVDDATQVVSEKIEFKTFNRSEEMKPFRCSDFSLHNLISIGAKLDDVKMQTSTLSNADNLAKVLGSISETISDETNV